jgi:L-threonylcarbamoyladenylate synthase
VDAGPCRVGIESTIVDMTRDVPVVLRPGAVTPSMIEEALGVPVETPWKHAERVPGNMQAHYQPEKPLLLVPGRDLEAHLQRERHVAVVHHSRLAHSADATFYRMSADRAEYARSLYETLHRIDNTDVEKILVESPPAGSDWADVLDRLSKAAAK